MIEDDDDLRAYVSRLESLADAGLSIDEDDDDFDIDDEDDSQLQFDFALDDDQTAETLMEEVEQFLRDQEGH
jgi:hypothetical protein